MTKLIFIRHGQSTANKDRIMAGWFDAPLTELGIEQAKLTGAYIAKNYNVDVVYASDLKRAHQTANEFCKIVNKEPILSDKLREIHTGDWEGTPYEIMPVKYEKEFYVWQHDIGKAVCTGGESIKDLYERINSEVDKIVKENPNKTIAIFSHATAIRVFTTRALGYNYEDTTKVDWTPNASISVFEEKDGAYTPIVIGDNSFHGEKATYLPGIV